MCAERLRRMGGEAMTAHTNIDSAIYDGNLADNPAIAYQIGLMTCCPEMGTLACISCSYADGKARDICDFKCRACDERENCACSKEGYLGR